MSFNFTVKEFLLGNGTGTPTLQFYKRGFELNGGGESPSWQDIILSGNTALTLTNALANSLNYVKLFGGTEQRNLPSEYTQVEYLQSSGNEYIDLGGVLDTSTDDVELDIQLLNNTSTTNIFGARNNTTARVYTLAIYEGGYWRWGWKNNSTTSDVTVDLNKHVLRIDHTNNTLSLDGTVIETKGSAVSNITTPTTPTLFAIHATSGSDYYFGALKVFGFKKWTNGVLAQNLIPCRRNSDNVLGMYDLVSDTFLTNAGTGTFTAGANVVPSPDTPMDIVCNNGVVKVNSNLYSTEYHDEALSQTNGVTTSSGAGVNISAMVDCRTIKSFKITTVSPQGSFRIFKYGAKNTFINATSTANIGDIITLENNVSFFRIQYNYTSFGTSTENILIYNSAYNLNEIYADGITETVEITGKNLFDVDHAIIAGAGAGTLLNYDTYIENGIVYNGGKIGYNAGSGITIPVSAGDYTVSFVLNGEVASYELRAVTLNNPNNNIFASYTAIKTGSITSLGNFSTTFTMPSGYTHVALLVFSTNKYGSWETNVMLEQGSTATTYEPYYYGGSATAENLFKVGTYQDVQSVIDGSVTRNIGIKVLDGTETCAINSNMFRITVTLPVEKQTGWQTRRRCTHGVCGGASGSNMLIEVDANAIWFGGGLVTNMGWTTADMGKQFLADQYANGTPVIIVYPKSSPTTESVTGQSLTTQAGTNIVEITQGSIDNLSLEVSYKATV